VLFVPVTGLIVTENLLELSAPQDSTVEASMHHYTSSTVCSHSYGYIPMLDYIVCFL
jgi:hypothetical protein